MLNALSHSYNLLSHLLWQGMVVLEWSEFKVLDLEQIVFPEWWSPWGK